MNRKFKKNYPSLFLCHYCITQSYFNIIILLNFDYFFIIRVSFFIILSCSYTYILSILRFVLAYKGYEHGLWKVSRQMKCYIGLCDLFKCKIVSNKMKLFACILFKIRFNIR